MGLTKKNQTINFLLLFGIYASLAQLVEQLICNQQVIRSSRIGSSLLYQIGQVPERPNGTDCKSVVFNFGGSNPPLPIPRRRKQNHQTKSLNY